MDSRHPGSMALLMLPALFGSQAHAHELPYFSVTPIGGYTFGGEFKDAAATTAVEVDDAPHFGVILNVRESANTQWEILYSRQQSEADTSALPAGNPADTVDLDVQYFHVGGTYVADGGLARPYLAATVGATRFDPDPLTFNSENFFSFGIGVGFQLQPMDRLGLRLESRVLGTFLRSDTDLFCRTGPEENLCAIATDSDTWWQWQTSLGLVFRF
ncbi:MAG TPA: outer membrane beta-barrel protein [Woeseiaceae bacterium]|nr:outer membrane beta-barrel protein [Woeseiaceae bacterium]